MSEIRERAVKLYPADKTNEAYNCAQRSRQRAYEIGYRDGLTMSQSKLDKAVEALETIAKTEKTIYPHSMDNDKRFNMGIASAALREINEKSP